MVSLSSCSLTYPPYEGIDGDPSTQSVARMSELNEITNFIMLNQVLARHSFADKLGLPVLSKSSDLAAIMQIEDCLDKLETSHASLLLVSTPPTHSQDGGLERQRFLFQIR